MMVLTALSAFSVTGVRAGTLYIITDPGQHAEDYSGKDVFH